MTMDYRPQLSLQGIINSSADEFVENMSSFADCSEDELINITFEVCSTKDTGTVPASAFIKYVEDVTGYNHENSKLLLLYNMLDPERQNVLIDRETFLATMKKWITICCEDCIPEIEVDECRVTTNGNLQPNDMMSLFLSGEDAEIFEGRAEDSAMAFDLNSSVENLKYTSQKMTEKLLRMQKVMEMSEETYLQLADDIVDLRGRLTSMQKLIENFKYIYTELEDIKTKTANLHEENHVISECVTRLKKQVDSLSTKLISLEENSKTYEERNTSPYQALLTHLWECFQNLLHEIKSQKNSMFQTLMEEIELKQKIGHSLLTVVQTFASLCTFIKAWNRILRRLDKFLDGPQLLAKSTCLNNAELHETEELGEMNDCPEQSALEAEIQTSSMMNDHQCSSGKAKISAPKGHTEASLNKTALQTEDAVSFNSKMLTQTEEKDQITILYQVWKKMLEVEGKWENPEGKLEVILETAKSLVKDRNNVLNEKHESNKNTSQHKIQPEPRKKKSVAAGEMKESVFRILGEISENILESSKTNAYIQHIIKVFQLWISEDEESFQVPEYSKETENTFKMEEKMSYFTQSTEQINFDDFSQCEGSLVCMENKLPDCFSVHQTNNKKDDEKYSRQEEITLDMKNREHSKEAACCESTPVLPVYFSSFTSGAIHYLDCNNSILETSLIEALNLEHISTRKRCGWTFPNLLFLGQRPVSRENLLYKKRHIYQTEHGGKNKSRTREVNSQVSTGDEVNHLHSAPLPNYSAATQRTLDLKAPQFFCSEVNLKHIFPSVHGLFSPHYNPMLHSAPIMPTLPEDDGQPVETHHSILPPTDQEPPVEVAISNTPAIVLPENTVIQDTERERNLSLRPISPYLRHSNRHTRASDTSLTSVDNTGHVIDLVNDQLPDVKISDEDKKKNIELLEEAKRVSERFLTRRGRKSRSSLSESPTGMSPTLSPNVSPAPSRSNSFNLPSPTGSDACAFIVGSVSPLQNATKGVNDRKQNDQRKLSQGRLLPHLTSFENPKEKLSEQKENFDPHKLLDNLSRSCTSVSNVGRVSMNTSTNTCEHELGKSFLKITKEKDFPFKGNLQGPGMATIEPKLKSLVPLLKGSKVTCKTELTPSGTHPPLLRSISWDHVEPVNIEKAPFKQPSDYDKNVAAMNKSSNTLTKQLTFKDLQIQVQPVRMQKLSKLREEHILMRNQNLVGLKLPDLSEAAEQERGSSPSLLEEEEEETAENSCDVMPNIPDALLRKLRVHTPHPGSLPPLTEKEVENVFIQLSLAFRNDSYTLESRINQAERERNFAEENTEKELDNFKAAITSSASLWHHSEHREMYQKLLEDITVLHRLASRLSSRAEMVGAVRQEKRMSKATEVMMQYVENLKRTYEKDHAELMEYKKLANQNSSRSYGSPEDGVPRTSRSMSLTVGKAPRRRVSVAVVSKFEIPGQSPSMSPIPLMPSLTESTNGRNNVTTTPALPALTENGKSNGDPDCESPPSAPAQSGMEEIGPVIKAKIEEEAYNKGYQEGLKKARELEELIEDDKEKIVESFNECKEGESDEKIGRHGKLEVVIHYIQILYPKLQKQWNVLWIAAAIVIIFAVVLGISSLYNYFSSSAELSDGQVKATCSAAQQYSWWNSGLQHDQHTE